MQILPKDLKYSILALLPLTTCIDFGSTNRYNSTCLADDRFWDYKFKQDYTEFYNRKPLHLNWKEWYKKIAYDNVRLYCEPHPHETNNHVEEVARGVVKIINCTDSALHIDIYNNVWEFGKMQKPRKIFTGLKDCQKLCGGVMKLDLTNRLYLDDVFVAENVKNIHTGMDFGCFITLDSNLFLLQTGEKHQITFIANNVEKVVISHEDESPNYIYFITITGELWECIPSLFLENPSDSNKYLHYNKHLIVTRNVKDVAKMDKILYIVDKSGKVQVHCPEMSPVHTVMNGQVVKQIRGNEGNKIEYIDPSNNSFMIKSSNRDRMRECQKNVLDYTCLMGEYDIYIKLIQKF